MPLSWGARSSLVAVIAATAWLPTGLALAEEGPRDLTEISAGSGEESRPPQEHEQEHELEGEVDGKAVRFSHPLTFISPTPETLVRVGHLFQRINDREDEARENQLLFIAEYAFHPTFSVEVEAPVVFRDPDGGSSKSNLGEVKIGAHFANLGFLDHGFVVGYGLEVGLPTGDTSKEIDSGHIVRTNPFLSVGYVNGKLEVAGAVAFVIPWNQREHEEVENEFEYDFGVHYWFSRGLIGFTELNGSTVMNGEEEGHTVVGLHPGLKVRPLKLPVEFAFGVGVPLTDREHYDYQTFFSLFYFF